MNGKNQTRYRSLDKYASDPRVVRIWEERGNGVFAELADGYNCEGCSDVHGCPDEHGKGALADFRGRFALIERNE